MWPLAFSHICESHILYRVAAIRLLYLLEQFRLTLKENVGKLHCSNRPALVHRAIDAVAVATALLSPSYPLGLVAGHVSWNYRGPFETTHRTTFPGPIFPAFGSKQRSKKVQKKQIPWEVGRSPAVWISATTKRYTPWEPRWVPSERTCILFAQCFFCFSASDGFYQSESSEIPGWISQFDTHFKREGLISHLNAWYMQTECFQFVGTLHLCWVNWVILKVFPAHLHSGCQNLSPFQVPFALITVTRYPPYLFTSVTRVKKCRPVWHIWHLK